LRTGVGRKVRGTDKSRLTWQMVVKTKLVMVVVVFMMVVALH